MRAGRERLGESEGDGEGSSEMDGWRVALRDHDARLGKRLPKKGGMKYEVGEVRDWVERDWVERE